MMVVQALWNVTWAAAALGVEHKLNYNGTAAGLNSMGGQSPFLAVDATPTPTSNGGNSGAIAVFLMLISFYWGSQVRGRQSNTHKRCDAMQCNTMLTAERLCISVRVRVYVCV